MILKKWKKIYSKWKNFYSKSKKKQSIFIVKVKEMEKKLMKNMILYYHEILKEKKFIFWNSLKLFLFYLKERRNKFEKK